MADEDATVETEDQQAKPDEGGEQNLSIDWKAEAEAAKAEAESLKAEKKREAWVKAASKKTGVPAELLRGATEEEIEAHAESLKSYVGKKAAPVVYLGNPSSEEKPSEKAEFARQLFGRG